MNLIKPPFMVLVWNPDAPGPNDDIMAKVYTRLKSEGLYDTVFHENPSMTFAQYMSFFSRPNVLVQLCLVTDAAGVPIDIAGFAYLSDFDQMPTHRRAAGSFCFFREYQTPKWTGGFAPLMFGYWFSRDGLAIDTLVGLTPKPNRTALAFCRRIGMNYIVDVPGYTHFRGERCDACLAVMNYEDYQRKYCQEIAEYAIT